jgi:hypothetical protein
MRHEVNGGILLAAWGFSQEPGELLLIVQKFLVYPLLLRECKQEVVQWQQDLSPEVPSEAEEGSGE